MANRDIEVNNLIINELTKSEFESITEKSETELYFVTDEDVQSGGGLEIGDIGTALYIDETQGKRRRLNGSILAINENTQGFVDWLKSVVATTPSLSTTEENWQSELALSKLGQCGKFVIDEANATVRLPKVVNINGLQDLSQAGVRVDESLPNIKLKSLSSYSRTDFLSNEDNGAIYFSGISSSINANGSVNGQSASLDYSLKNSTYQDNAPVQQEAIQYPYFIQIATGAETEVNIVNEIELNNPCSFGDYKYSDVEINNLSWLRSQGQWNSRAVYVDYYNWILSNVNDSVDKFKKSTDDYTDYDWVVNTTDETFRLPLLPMERVVVETGEENGIKYRIYNDGYCEQFGIYTTSNSEIFNVEISFVKKYKDINFDIVTGLNQPNAYESQTQTANINQSVTHSVEINRKSVNGFYINRAISNNSISWIASGYLAGDQYTQCNNYKYYYVGETIQNAKLVDIGRLAEQLASKTDIEQATASSFPSNRYIDLTLGASDTRYTAPANGYFQLNKSSANTNQWARLENVNNLLSIQVQPNANGASVRLFLPVKMGDVIICSYNLSGATQQFRFIYAEGEA